MNTLELLQKKEAELRSQLELIRDMIRSENEKQSPKSDAVEVKKSHRTMTEGYDKKDSITRKIRFVFEKEKRFLHIREIVEFITRNEPDQDEKILKRRLSTNLNRMKRIGVLTNVQYNKSLLNVFWGSINWLDESGKIKNGYEYRQELVNKAGKQIEMIL